MKIWWLTDVAIDALEATGSLDRLPAYVRREARNLDGRNGRGRLWIDPTLGPVEVKERHFKSATGRWISLESMGGIVVRDEDAAALVELPGFLTDLELKRWPAVPGPDQVT